MQEDVKNAAHALVNAVKLQREGKLAQPDEGIHEAGQK